MENLDQWINIVGAVLALLTMIAAVTPTKTDNGIVDRLNNIFKKLTGRN
jgi:hypothetical protein